MSAPPDEQILDIARELFSEAYDGALGDATWFVNHGPGAGVFGAIDGLSAAQASAVPNGCDRSIAAHVEHLRWSLANVNAVARGGAWNPDWSASWSVQAVDDAQWDDLRAALRREYELVCDAMSAMPAASDRMMLTGLLAMAPHAAHHLGTIRTMVKRIEAETE